MVTSATQRQHERRQLVLISSMLIASHGMRMAPEDVDAHAYLSRLVADEVLASSCIRLVPLTLAADMSR
jgi:hypothetical protein